MQSADALYGQLRDAVTGGDSLDAYLVAGGLLQLVEDRLHPDRLQLGRIASALSQPKRSLPGRLVGGGAAVSAAVGDLPVPGRPSRLHQARCALLELTVRAATALLGPTDARPADVARIPAPLREIEPVVSLLGDEVMRLPACFHDFDQRPDDLRRLAEKLTATVDIPNDRPLIVIGIRTSGCYLAPLLVAALRAGGVVGARALTYRPGRTWLRVERQALRECARAGGLVVLIDDPPVSGRSMAAAAEAVTATGLGADRIVLALTDWDATDRNDAGRANSQGVPDALGHWPAARLPWREWAIHELLAPEAVRGALTALVDSSWQIGEPVAHSTARAPSRGHVRARYTVPFLHIETGRRESRELVIEGVGLGRFGRPAAVIAERLGEVLPRIYGVRDGLLYRDWIIEGPQPNPEILADCIADYTVRRQQCLPARRDPTGAMRGRGPIWEVAAYLLSGEFGSFGPPARLLLLEPLTRALLRVDRPSIADGATDHRHWIADSNAVRKIGFHRSPFGNRELACYDAVFGLAGAAADAPDIAFARALRAGFASRDGHGVDGERWLLYRLVQLWRLRRADRVSAAEFERRSAAVVHDYLAECILPQEYPVSGPICAIDLDGVLETGPLGYPITSPAGALALRALLAHGYRPIIATGRSVGDTRDRCRVFGLVGAVAEYGSAVYDAPTDSTIDLRTDMERSLLEGVRAKLSADPRIELVAGYDHSIRARIDGGPLPREMIDEVLAFEPGELRIVEGEGQTDIVAARIDKATGLTALIERLPGAAHRMTVGDSGEDLPILRSAPLSFAPRNADTRVRAAGITTTRHAYQAGLLDACTELLGHRPGGCAECRPPDFPPRTRALLAALAIRENGLPGVPLRTLRLAALRLRWLLNTPGHSRRACARGIVYRSPANRASCRRPPD
ncbi:HAD family hydrolase [Nocardia heshunensis]